MPKTNKPRHWKASDRDYASKADLWPGDTLDAYGEPVVVSSAPIPGKYSTWSAYFQVFFNQNPF